MIAGPRLLSQVRLLTRSLRAACCELRAQSLGRAAGTVVTGSLSQSNEPGSGLTLLCFAVKRHSCDDDVLLVVIVRRRRIQLPEEPE